MRKIFQCLITLIAFVALTGTIPSSKLNAQTENVKVLYWYSTQFPDNAQALVDGLSQYYDDFTYYDNYFTYLCDVQFDISGIVNNFTEQNISVYGYNDAHVWSCSDPSECDQFGASIDPWVLEFINNRYFQDFYYYNPTQVFALIHLSGGAVGYYTEEYYLVVKPNQKTKFIELYDEQNHKFLANLYAAPSDPYAYDNQVEPDIIQRLVEQYFYEEYFQQNQWDVNNQDDKVFWIDEFSGYVCL